MKDARVLVPGLAAIFETANESSEPQDARLTIVNTERSEAHGIRGTTKIKALRDYANEMIRAFEYQEFIDSIGGDE